MDTAFVIGDTRAFSVVPPHVEPVADDGLRGARFLQDRVSDLSDGGLKTSAGEGIPDSELDYLRPTRIENSISLASRWLGIVVFVAALGFTGYLLTTLVR
ncbi:hypothetical protein BH09PSE3_BH09PSE3_04160 [soil metagenome]